MERTFVSFPITDFANTKWKMLNWTRQFNIFCLLDNHQYQPAHHAHECLLAAGSIKSIQAVCGNAFDQLKQFAANQNDWLFGHFSYVLKNEIEALSSRHPDRIGFPDLFFFIPEVLIELKGDCVNIGSFQDDHAVLFDEIMRAPTGYGYASNKSVNLQYGYSKQEYMDTVESLRQHILRGDCYEINFCQELFATNTTLDPIQTYRLLAEISPAPFAALYRCNTRYLICASPERYLCRQGNWLTSQPIKGTWKRNLADTREDDLAKLALYNSAKDRSENVMVVDLVRNDLAKICREGSVHVDELYGIYSFPQVHQMISSVSGEALPGLHWTDMIRATFPMGSMTGAPKKRVMELIEQYEKTNRGLFSGSVGYVNPAGDFDFNVVIRSILYNEKENCLSCQVGSGLTFYSIAEKEYDECLLKAEAVNAVLTRIA